MRTQHDVDNGISCPRCGRKELCRCALNAEDQMSLSRMRAMVPDPIEEAVKYHAFRHFDMNDPIEVDGHEAWAKHIIDYRTLQKEGRLVILIEAKDNPDRLPRLYEIKVEEII